MELFSTLWVWGAEEVPCGYGGSWQVAAAAVSLGPVPIQSPIPSLSLGPMLQGHLPSSAPQWVCTACRKKQPKHGAGLPTWLPLCPCQLLGAGETEIAGQEVACPGESVPGLGRENRVLGMGWHCCAVCLQARVALSWVLQAGSCCYASPLLLQGCSAQGGILGNVALSP